MMFRVGEGMGDDEVGMPFASSPLQFKRKMRGHDVYLETKRVADL